MTAPDAGGTGPILIGQYDSPFVRRAAVAMHIHAIAYRHRPWSTFGDADRLAAFTPLLRVPVLVVEGGPPLIDSQSILDFADSLAGRALVPEAPAERQRARYVMSLAVGLAEKAVALVYERVLHAEPSAAWTARCMRQVSATLSVLETEAVARPQAFWFGASPGHADIALACALRFVTEAHAGLFDPRCMPALAAHAASCESLPAFRAAVQRFIPPA